jgi:hypothetical protein
VTLYMVEDLPFNILESGVPGGPGDGDTVRYKPRLCGHRGHRNQKMVFGDLSSRG